MRPGVVLFDVNETLSDLGPLAAAFEAAGAPGHLVPTWFASVLRDGFGLAAAGAAVPFAEVAAGVLRAVLLEAGVADADAGVASVMDALTSLGVHDDVGPGVRQLRAQGLRLVTLTNGSVAVSEGLLGRAGLREEFAALLSVEDAGAWKPSPAAYAYALRQTGVDAGAALLVAVHPWDVDGASRAGLRTAWVSRSGLPFPAHLRAPDLVVRDLPELAARLA